MPSVIVMVVVATFTALNSANRVTSLDRARSQADALAQQDEDELRSEPITKLSELSKTHEAYLQEVTKGGTHYTITSTARYIADKTATSSCTSTAESANYIETSSTVTWSSIGASKPVVETGIVSPPPDAALIVQVTGASGEPVSNMNVQATGPSSISTETSSDGCAILAVNPGEYTLNVTKAGYVDENGYVNSDNDPASSASFYVVAENTVKKSYEFAPAGGVAVKFHEPLGYAVEGDAFVVFNSALTAFKTFGTPGTYASPVYSTSSLERTVPSSKTLFPFTSKYIVYAGTCEADMPTNNGQSANPEYTVTANTINEEVVVPVVPINVAVHEGSNEASPNHNQRRDRRPRRQWLRHDANIHHYQRRATETLHALWQVHTLRHRHRHGQNQNCHRRKHTQQQHQRRLGARLSRIGRRRNGELPVRRLRTQLRYTQDERGYTLIELLVAMALGIVVSLAALGSSSSRPAPSHA